MEEKIKQMDVFEKVKSGTKDVKIFVSFDGVEFGDSDDCKKYEDRKILDQKIENLQIKTINGESFGFPEYFYFASNQDDVETIAQYLKYTQNYDYVYVDTIRKSQLINDIKIGEWYGQDYEDGGDYRGNVDIYSLSFVEDTIKREYKKFIECIKQ